MIVSVLLKEGWDEECDNNCWAGLCGTSTSTRVTSDAFAENVFGGKMWGRYVSVIGTPAFMESIGGKGELNVRLVRGQSQLLLQLLRLTITIKKNIQTDIELPILTRDSGNTRI